MNFGRRFKLYRKSKNLTQKQAAELLGVKPYQLANYESNRSEPNIRVLIGMSKAYCVSIDLLLGNAKEFGPTIEEREVMEKERREFQKELMALLKKFEFSDKH